MHYCIYKFLLDCCIMGIAHDGPLILLGLSNIDFTCIIRYLKSDLGARNACY